MYFSLFFPLKWVVLPLILVALWCFFPPVHAGFSQEPWQREQIISFFLSSSTMKPWETQPYLTKSPSAPVQMFFFSPKTEDHCPAHWPSSIHPFAGNHLDGKVDPSLPVNMITNGARGRMSSLIENVFLKSKCIKKMSLVFFSCCHEGKHCVGGQANSLKIVQPIYGHCQSQINKFLSKLYTINNFKDKD